MGFDYTHLSFPIEFDISLPVIILISTDEGFKEAHLQFHVFLFKVKYSTKPFPPIFHLKCVAFRIVTLRATSQKLHLF